MEKMVKARDELPKANHYGPTDARTGIITFGSTIGPVREAQGLLAAKGTPVQILQPQTLYPVPVHEIDPFLKSVDVCYVIEHNYTGQLARLLRETMPWQHAKLRSLTKYDGTNYRAPQIVAGLEGGA
jgi:pyruvate/2-oxoacid:ferredoxin oxidoreductase alpha subunit